MSPNFSQLFHHDAIGFKENFPHESCSLLHNLQLWFIKFSQKKLVSQVTIFGTRVPNHSWLSENLTYFRQVFYLTSRPFSIHFHLEFQFSFQIWIVVHIPRFPKCPRTHQTTSWLGRIEFRKVCKSHFVHGQFTCA